MKNVLLVLTLLFALGECDAQPFAIANTEYNILNSGLANLIKVAVSNTPCSDIRLIMDSAKVEETESPCEFMVQPMKAGSGNLELYSKRSGKLIGIQPFRIKSLSDYPTVTVLAGKTGGEIRLNVLKVQKGIRAETRIPACYGHIKVEQYTIILLRASKAIYTKMFRDQIYFDKEVDALFDQVQVGDTLIVCNVTGYNAAGNHIVASPLELKIVE